MNMFFLDLEYRLYATLGKYLACSPNEHEHMCSVGHMSVTYRIGMSLLPSASEYTFQ